MKKYISILLCVVLAMSCLFGFSGCAKKADKYQLVMITDGATISDGAYNQSAWGGVQSFADENDMACRYYQPNTEEDGSISADTVKKYIDLSVKNGAECIVLPGEKFSVAINDLAPEYQDVKFVLVDAVPHIDGDPTARTISNVMTIDFDSLQAGFLAGYTSVSFGNTKLGYFGSVSDPKSAQYGAGFVQGAVFAADKSATPVILDYANYDAEDLNYDYSFTIRPIYKPIKESKEKTFKVNVVNGVGTGVYTDGENVTITANAPEVGKVFDHWECHSDSEGVRDSKVNISSKSKSSMNLLVGDCDCTIAAVYKDVMTVAVTVNKTTDSMTGNGEAVEKYNVEANTTTEIVAPAADSGMVFDHWDCEEGVIEDVNNKWGKVTVGEKPVEITAVYTPSKTPTFDVTVENGTGSGSYCAGDYVQIVADAPQDGYMFYKWENIDNQELSTGIAMENEFCYITSFDMVDRFASVPETMFDAGTQVIFAGGNSQDGSVFNATKNYDYPVYAFGAGFDQNSWGNCLASVVNDYGAAIKLALKDFKGGTNLTGNCANECIYTTNIPEDNKDYPAVYKALASGKLTVQSPTGDVRTVANSKCLTLNYWVK